MARGRGEFEILLRILGAGQRRLEGRQKVTGAFEFTADLRIEGLAHVALVLSPHARARIVSIDVREARVFPGVIAVLTAAELPELTGVSANKPSLLEPVLGAYGLATAEVGYVGQPVAAIVAESEAIAADAADAVAITYEQLIPSLDVRRAAVDMAPSLEFNRGDVNVALADADAVVKGSYLAPMVHPSSIEGHLAVVRADNDDITRVWSPTQGAFMLRRRMAEVSGEPERRIVVTAVPAGGAFGAKIVLLEPLIAAVARKTGRPVRCVLDRRQEFLLGRGAPGAVIDLQLGADSAGHLVALWARVYFDNGFGAGVLCPRGLELLGGTYRVPNLHYEGYEVVTNKTPTFPYRAPGGPQVVFALESAMDEMARRLGVDPIELRIMNHCREGDVRPDGSVIAAIGALECLETARRHPIYTDRAEEDEGVGVGYVLWNGRREPSAASCWIEPDGSVVVQIGSADISGTNTTLAMIAAEILGTTPSSVSVQSDSTLSAPYAGVAGGSKVIYTVGAAVAKAATEVREQLLTMAARVLEVAPEDLVLLDSNVQVRGAASRKVSFGALATLPRKIESDYAPVHGFGRVAPTDLAPMAAVHVVRANIDRETGEFAVTRYLSVQDVGRALNPPEVQGQIHGGIVQGLGRALGEELVHDHDGQPLTSSFIDYGLPTIEQVPRIESILIEVPSPEGPFGARGVGEPPAVPGAAAVANAVRAAGGVDVVSLPIRPSDVLAQLEDSTVTLGSSISSARVNF